METKRLYVERQQRGGEMVKTKETQDYGDIGGLGE